MSSGDNGDSLSIDEIKSARNATIAGYCAVSILSVTIFLLYGSTMISMVSVWQRSSTFIHGFMVLPLSAYLIWSQRKKIESLVPKSSALGGLLLICSIGLWLVSSFAAIQVGQQFAFIAMLITGAWTLLGTEIVGEIRFPLLSAFLAVPFGEFMVPYLIDWTANFTVAAVQLSGIPVYLEGSFFSLPSGNFEVVEACSGIRYLIVTLVLAVYFVQFTYAGWRKRALFLVAAAGTMIIANGIRAYLIVLIAHISNMQSSIVNDHNWLGWIVFAVAISSLFWVGSGYADPDSLFATKSPKASRVGGKPFAHRMQTMIATFIVAQVAVLSAPTILNARSVGISGSVLQPSLPLSGVGWRGPGDARLDYFPSFGTAEYALAGAYDSPLGSLEMHIAFVSGQGQGRELINQTNTLFNADVWRVAYSFDVESIEIEPGRELHPATMVLTDGTRQLLLWYWYDVGGRITNRATVAKVFHAWNLAAGENTGDALIAMVTPIADADVTGSSATLTSFIQSHGKRLFTCLRPVDFDVSVCGSMPE